MKNYLQQSFTQYVQEKNIGEEQIDLYDENRKYIRTIHRYSVIHENEWKKCILCFVIDREGNVLIEHKRNHENDGCSGHIKHNEVATQAMLREMKEELNIDITESLQAKHLGNIKINSKELRCFLDVYCLFRTRDTQIEVNTDEIDTIEKMPFEIFIEKFLNGEIFPCTSEYEPIIQELVRQWKEQFHKEKVTNWER